MRGGSEPPLFISPLLSLIAMASFSAAANLLSSSFEKKTRDDGSSFWALSSDSPDWLRSAVMLVHEDEAPNDSRYELIRDAAVALSDQSCEDEDEAREALYEIAVDLVPSYTGQLLAWFAERPARLSDCDEALQDGRVGEISIYEILTEGYRLRAESVLSVLISEIEENRSSVFNPDTDCRLLLSDAHGRYLPQVYCESISKTEAKEMNLDWWAVETCQHGPDEEHYWEAWQSILDSAEITEPATLKEDESLWRLHQNGDLWLIRSDVEIPEEWLC
jgi:hypothetical protein